MRYHTSERTGDSMNYLVISDIHGSRSGAELCEEALQLHQPDAVLCLGDILYHGPRNPVPDTHDPKEAARILNQYAERIFAVRGNCEAEVDSLLLEFPVTADYNSFLLNDRRVFMTHVHLFQPDQCERTFCRVDRPLTRPAPHGSGHAALSHPALYKVDTPSVNPYSE